MLIVCEYPGKSCPFHESPTRNAKLDRSFESSYGYNETITASCNEGYWFAMESQKKSVTFICSAGGVFVPQPEHTFCTGWYEIMRFYTANCQIVVPAFPAQLYSVATVITS